MCGDSVISDIDQLDGNVSVCSDYNSRAKNQHFAPPTNNYRVKNASVAHHLPVVTVSNMRSLFGETLENLRRINLVHRIPPVKKVYRSMFFVNLTLFKTFFLHIFVLSNHFSCYLLLLFRFVAFREKNINYRQLLIFISFHNEILM